MIRLPSSLQSPFPSIISFARESESLVNDIFILAIASTGISGQIGVTVGANVGANTGTDRTAVVTPADIATTPIAAVAAT